jgi:eukaryotic-like serine/threonine-protein kinase
MTHLGRYEIFEELGSGSMGTVFRGRDPMIDRFVAIKTIRMQGFAPGETEGFRERFIREAQAAGKLSHPGIVTIYDVGSDDETRSPYLVMEFVAGQTLDQLLRESPESLPVEKSLGIVKQIAEALDYAHAQGIVHRDIKPANIILTPAGRAIIMDFGVARLRKSQLTMQGEVIGTPSFMSPEQVRGERVDGRADLFSLGVVLYWMLTREKPFTGDLATLMYKIVHENPAVPSAVNPSLSPDFDAVVARAMAKTREARYQTGDEFAGDLDCLLTGQTPLTPAPTAAALAADGTVQLPTAKLPGAPTTVKHSLRERSSDLAASLSARLRKQIADGTTKFKTLSRLAQTAAAAVALALLALAVWTLIPSPQSRMLVLLQHNLKSGNLSVWVDDKLVVKESLVYDEIRRFPFSSSRYVGRFSQNVPLRAGARNIRVQVASSDPEFNETRKLDGDFPENGQLTLSINCDSKRQSLQVSLR